MEKNKFEEVYAKNAKIILDIANKNKNCDKKELLNVNKLHKKKPG